MPTSQLPQEEKTGVVEAFYETDTGSIRENGSNTSRDFFQHGASMSFVVGDLVTYINVTLPNGRVITKDIKKPTN